MEEGARRHWKNSGEVHMTCSLRSPTKQSFVGCLLKVERKTIKALKERRSIAPGTPRQGRSPGKALAAAVLFAVSAWGLAYGSEGLVKRSEISRELDRTRQQMERERRALDELMGREGRLLEKLAALKRQLARSRSRLSDLAAKKRNLEEQERELVQKISDLEAELAEKKRSMGERLSARYRFERRGSLSFWLGAESISALSRRARYLEDLFLADKKKVESYKTLLAELFETQEELSEKRRDLDSLHRVELEQERALARQKSSYEGMLRKVNLEREAHEQLLAELKRSAERLESLIEELAKEGSSGGEFESRKGSLCFPAPGEVVSEFGKKVHPRFLTVTMQKGIEIGAGGGAPVRAVSSGVVRFAEWFMGYGNLVILDHGNGFYTLYGHLAEFRSGVGGRVERGEVIGLVGDTGSLSGPSLYFEIRRRLTPMDPAEWLADCVEG